MGGCGMGGVGGGWYLWDCHCLYMLYVHVWDGVHFQQQITTVNVKIYSFT